MDAVKIPAGRQNGTKGRGGLPAGLFREGAGPDVDSQGPALRAGGGENRAGPGLHRL